MTLPSETFSEDPLEDEFDAPLAVSEADAQGEAIEPDLETPDPAPDGPDVHAVLIDHHGGVRCVRGGRAAVLAEIRPLFDARLVDRVLLFEGRRVATTTPPIRAVFGPDDVVPLATSAGPGYEVDDEGLVDPDYLGPPPAAALPATVVPVVVSASPFDDLDDGDDL